MFDYEYITTDERLFSLISHLNELESIAVDFEEECNLHIYGEHISIIQIYDKTKFYIIDVLSENITNASLSALFSSEVEKIWFECHSDLSILFYKHGIKAENVYDLRVLAKELGDMHGLDEVLFNFLGIRRTENKKKSQRENWMLRPIEEEMLNYALLDVKYLFDLKDALIEECRAKKRLKNVEKAMKNISDVKEKKPGWTKICNVNQLTKKERIYLKNIFNYREAVARRFNTPSVNVLEKKCVLELAKLMPMDKKDVESYLSKKAPRRYLAFIIEAVNKAIDQSNSEIAALRQ